MAEEPPTTGQTQGPARTGLARLFTAPHDEASVLPQLLVAGVLALVVTYAAVNLVVGALGEKFRDDLTASGLSASKAMVRLEEDNLRVLRHLSHEMHADDAARDAWQQHWIREGFGALEKMIADGSDFCHGGAPTLADAFLIPQVANAQRVKLDLSPFPRIQRIYDACMKLPAFEKAHPKNHPAAAK